MQKTMRKHGITVTQISNDLFKVSGKLDGKPWCVHCCFREAGEIAHEMADNNDEGNAINRRMCEVFGRRFF